MYCWTTQGIFCTWLIRPQNFREWVKVFYPNSLYWLDGNFNLKQGTTVLRRSICSALQLNFALCAVDGHRHALTALTSGKTRYLLYRGLGGPLCWSGRMRKIWPPSSQTGFDCQTTQPVASRYTDRAIPANVFSLRDFKLRIWMWRRTVNIYSGWNFRNFP